MRHALGAALLLWAGTAAAADIPEPARGAWAAGGCDAPSMVLEVTARSVAELRAPGSDPAPQHLWRADAVTGVAGWTIATLPGPLQPRLLLRRTAAGLDFMHANPKLRDDQLPGDDPPATLRPCPTLPLSFSLLHGEGIAFLQAIEAVEAPCRAGEAAACVTGLLAYADVSGDVRLGPAELARVLRGASWAAMLARGATADAMAAELTASLGPSLRAARTLVDLLDFEGRGSITASALLQDRSPLPSPAPVRAREASPLPLEGLATILGPLAQIVGPLPGPLTTPAP